MRPVKIGNKLVGINKPVFIIAEAGSNHNGKLEQARRLIDIAADAGVDAVKFQLFKADKIYPENCGVVRTPMGDIDFFKVLKEIELPLTWLKELKKYAEKKGLIFLCSCFDEESADILEDIGMSAYKLGAPELNHIPLLEHVAKKHKPVILSTGLCNLGEIEEAINTCNHSGNKRVILLHCVSAYPTPLKDCNLNIIRALNLAFNIPVGFSDHTLDSVLAPVIAVTAGANIIEKHFTLSKKLKGPDHSFALEPNELDKMVKAIRKTERIDDKFDYVNKLFGLKKVKLILGSYRKVVVPSEREIYPNDKRSIHIIQDIKKGDILNETNVRILRSERNLSPGIHPRYYSTVLGKKINRDIPYGSGLKWADLLISSPNSTRKK